MQHTVVTSDTHAYHTNIIKYSKRPFSDVNQMNQTMADNINAALPNGGRLIHCGDWAFGSIDNCRKFRHMLRPGIQVTLILGNHDKRFSSNHEFRILFNRIYDLYEETWNHQRIVFCHYAMRTWNTKHYKTWHCFGHSHNTLPVIVNDLSLDIGVDGHNFKPWIFNEIKHVMTQERIWPSLEI